MIPTTLTSAPRKVVSSNQGGPPRACPNPSYDAAQATGTVSTTKALIHSTTGNSLVSSFVAVAIMIIALAFPTTSAVALIPSGPDVQLFTNDYVDHLHPQCRRQIQVGVDGTRFHYSGTFVASKDDTAAASTRGCSPNEANQFGGLQKTFLDGTIAENKISSDDGTLQGVWEPAGSTAAEYGDVDGIRWSDGTKWTVKEKTLAVQIGEFITFSYIGVSLLAGVNGVYKMSQRNKKSAN